MSILKAENHIEMQDWSPGQFACSECPDPQRPIAENEWEMSKRFATSPATPVRDLRIFIAHFSKMFNFFFCRGK